MRIRIIRSVGLQDIFAIICCISLIYIQFHEFADDPGVGWHLATGSWILTNKQILDFDPFLASTVQRPWIAGQWLADVIFSFVYSYTSWRGVFVAITILFLLGYMGALFIGVMRLAKTCLGASFAVLIAFKLAQIHFLFRPTVLGFFLFIALYLFVFERYRSASDRCGLFSRRDIFLLSTLFVLWANLHGSFVVGLVLISALAASHWIDQTAIARRLFNESAPVCEVRSGLLAVVLCLLATFVNPYGWRLHGSIVRLAGSQFFMNYHQEWLPPDFLSYEGSLLLFVGGVVLSVIAFARKIPPSWRTFELVLFAIFFLWGARTVRMLPYFGIAVSVQLAEILSFPGRSGRLPMRLREAFAFIDRREGRSYLGAPVLVFATVGLILVAGRLIPAPFKSEPQPSKTRYPYDSLEALKEEHGGRAGSLIVAAPPAWGGFITWYGAGEVKAVIDDRNILLGEQAYRSYERSRQSIQALESYLVSVHAEYLLLPVTEFRRVKLNDAPFFELIYKDKQAKLYRLRKANG